MLKNGKCTRSAVAVIHICMQELHNSQTLYDVMSSYYCPYSSSDRGPYNITKLVSKLSLIIVLIFFDFWKIENIFENFEFLIFLFSFLDLYIFNLRHI